MAYEDKTVPYEILIRFGVDGKPKGAHILRRRIITVDGEVVKDDCGIAEPLNLQGFATSGLMTETAKGALESLMQANVEIEAMKAHLGEYERAHATLVHEMEALKQGGAE